MSVTYKLSKETKQRILKMSAEELYFEKAKFEPIIHPSEYYDAVCTELNNRRNTK